MGMKLFSAGSGETRGASGPIGCAGLSEPGGGDDGAMVPASWRSGAEDAARRHPLEPDPAKWTIERAERVGNATVARIRYPNCANYEGNKVLVYLGVAPEALRAERELDPHFLEGRLSPVARFEPTERGWGFAMAFAKLVG